ncbi:MAG TPA: glucose-6-phosphate isomerase [Micavibrio sp.]
MALKPLQDEDTFQALRQHRETLAAFTLRAALQDQARTRDLTIPFAGALFDFSKHLVQADTIALFGALAQARGLAEARAQMFAGVPINTTENRAVLHVALRAPDDADIRVGGRNIMPDVIASRAQMKDFSTKIRADKNITDVVNIGIGGSDLGPRFVTEALQHLHDGPRVHFVSNVDGRVIRDVLARCRPENTLILIASKTFTTEETMLNARYARDWLVQALGASQAASHMAALTAADETAQQFGVPAAHIFCFAEWVGGRYSLWSSIGLAIMLAVGPAHFEQLLAGAHAMDRHFCEAPFEKNIPMLMGLLGVWYRNVWDYPAHLLLPYDQRLARLAKFIQQLDMESNGKGVDRTGRALALPTGPVIFGEPGTDSQHSFMQSVHQGAVIPADFIAVKKPDHDLGDHHAALLTHCLAQSRALAMGQTLSEVGGDPHRVCSGNRPSTTIMLPTLDAFYLGALIAAYEHKVFVQGVIWGVNSFDQFGVELGKHLAKAIAPHMRDRAENMSVSESGLDASTAQLLRFLSA